MNQSSKFSLIGLLVVCGSLFSMDWEATTLPSFEYNQVLGIVLVFGICLTVVGGILADREYKKIHEELK